MQFYVTKVSVVSALVEAENASQAADILAYEGIEAYSIGMSEDVTIEPVEDEVEEVEAEDCCEDFEDCDCWSDDEEDEEEEEASEW